MTYKEYIQQLLSEVQDGKENILEEATNTQIYYGPNSVTDTNKKGGDLVLGIPSGISIDLCSCLEDYTGTTTTDTSPCTLYCSGYDPCPSNCSNDAPIMCSCEEDFTGQGGDICSSDMPACPTHNPCSLYCLRDTGACDCDTTYQSVCTCYTGTCDQNSSVCSCDVNCNCYAHPEACEIYVPFSCDCHRSYTSECTCYEGSWTCGTNTPVCNGDCPQHCACDTVVEACNCYEGAATCTVNTGYTPCTCNGTHTACTCYEGSLICSENVGVCTCDACDGCNQGVCTPNCSCYGYVACPSYTASYAWYAAFAVNFSGRVGDEIYQITTAATRVIELGYYNTLSGMSQALGVPMNDIGTPSWQVRLSSNWMIYWVSGTNKYTTASKTIPATYIYATGHQIKENVSLKARLVYTSGRYGKVPANNTITASSYYTNIITLDQNKYTVQINGPAVENDAQSEIISPYGAYYGFIYSSSLGYYTSQNMGVKNSCAMCRLSFTASRDTTLTFSFINYAEKGYDYGSFGRLDMPLTSGNSKTNVLLSCSALNSSSVQHLDYTITQGTHYIDIKFWKDGSNNTNNDSLRFNYSFGDSNIGKAHYSVLFGSPLNLSARTGSHGICSVWSSASTNMVAVSIARRGSVSLLGTCLAGETLEYVPPTTYELTTTKVLSSWTQDVNTKETVEKYLAAHVSYDNPHGAVGAPGRGSNDDDYQTYNTYDDKEDYGMITWRFSSAGIASYKDYITSVTIEVKAAAESDSEEDGEGNPVTNYAYASIRTYDNVRAEDWFPTYPRKLIWSSTSATFLAPAVLNNTRVKIEFGWNGIQFYGASMFLGIERPRPTLSQDPNLMWTDDLSNGSGLKQNPEYESTKKGTRLHDIQSLSGVSECTTYDLKTS